MFGKKKAQPGGPRAGRSAAAGAATLEQSSRREQGQRVKVPHPATGKKVKRSRSRSVADVTAGWVDAERLARLDRSADAKKSKKVKGAKAAAPTRYGWPGRYGGRVLVCDSPPEWRGPTVQVAGLYPFSAGGSLTMVGAALGPHLEGRGIVCCDPVSWFAAGLISNPSAFILARPGLGKSSLVRHILAQLPDKGIIPLVLSDLKGEHVDLVAGALGGQVIAPGRGAEYVNPLDRGPLVAELGRLPEKLRAKAIADLAGRRNNVVAALIELALGAKLEAHERNVLNAAIEQWQAAHPDQTPVMQDIHDFIETRPESLSRVAQDRGDSGRYQGRIERLMDGLLALCGDGVFGEVFARPTTNPLQMHRPAVFDLSAVEAMDDTLQAGLQLVCWTYGSAAVSAAKYLADAGLAPRRTYALLMDEMWKALRAAPFMVDRVDEITRLNRTMNLAQILITHTMRDLQLDGPDGPLTAKAYGFVERSSMVFLGGLAPKEMGNLTDVFAMSQKEEALVTSWAAPGRPNPSTGQVDPPVGRGKFLLKTGKDVGIPFQVALVPAEKAVNDTNQNWADTIASLNRAGVDVRDVA